MKKEILVTIISAIIALMLFAMGICIGENQMQDTVKIQRASQALDKMEQITGYKNLGVLDAYKISSKTGYTYNGPAILTILFRQNDLELPLNYRINTIDCDFMGGIGLYRIDERDGARIVKSYVYGLY